MSPTRRCPGAGAVKSRRIRSGAGAALVSCLVSDRRRRRVIPDEAAFAHDPFDAFAVDPQAAAAQLGGDPRRPVASVFGLDLPDQGGEVLVVGLPRLPGGFGGQPLVVALPALDRQNTAQPRHTVDGVVLGDEPVAADQ